MQLGDRLSKSLLVASFVKECIDDKEQQVRSYLAHMDGYSQDDLDDLVLGNETFTILCTESLSSTVLTMMSILEKGVNECLVLLKVLDKKYITISPDSDEYRPKAASKMALYPVVKKICEIIQPLISFSVGESCLERILTCITRIYKLEIALIKDLIQNRPTVLPPMFKLLLTETAGDLSKKIHEYLNDSNEDAKRRDGVMSTAHTTKRKRGMDKKPVTSSGKLGKVIPGLIYQMEEFDVQLIKFAGVITGEKSFISKLVKRSQIRDFRLKVGGVHSARLVAGGENNAQAQNTS